MKKVKKIKIRIDINKVILLNESLSARNTKHVENRLRNNLFLLQNLALFLCYYWHITILLGVVMP